MQLWQGTPKGEPQSSQQNHWTPTVSRAADLSTHDNEGRRKKLLMYELFMSPTWAVTHICIYLQINVCFLFMSLKSTYWTCGGRQSSFPLQNVHLTFRWNVSAAAWKGILTRLFCFCTTWNQIKVLHFQLNLSSAALFCLFIQVTVSSGALWCLCFTLIQRI